mgnify:FL=1
MFPPVVKLKYNTIELYIRPHTDTAKRKEILDEWYRAKLKEMIPVLIAKWEKVMAVEVKEFGIKKMKTNFYVRN